MNTVLKFGQVRANEKRKIRIHVRRYIYKECEFIAIHCGSLIPIVDIDCDVTKIVFIPLYPLQLLHTVRHQQRQ